MRSTPPPKLDVPVEYQPLLREVTPKYTRSDAAILQSLTQHNPITSEKNIWAFWDKGASSMPTWCQRNVFDWVRISSSSPEPWTIRVLDAIPTSPNYALKFISTSQLPSAFVNGELTGPYIGPHSADFLRGALLYKHGGVFMDVGNILFRNLDRVGWNHLSDDTSPYRIAVPIMYDQVLANHFVMSRKGDPFIKTWHELFVHFWRDGRQNYKGILSDPLLEFATNLDFSGNEQANYHWDFNVDPITVFEYISQNLAWLRLTMLDTPIPDTEPPTITYAAYWQTRIFCFDPLHESWGAESTIGFKGQDLYDCLGLSTTSDPSTPEFRKAQNLVYRLLSKSSIQKITHGKNLTASKHLGVLWDEHEGSDIERGTFAEVLRYASTHLEQTRREIVRIEAKPFPNLIRKGVWEA